MESINISVVRRQLEADAPPIINWNTDYILNFSFDEEWEDTKTIRIVNDKGAVILDEIFMGNSYELPKISNTGHIGIGLYAGDLKSTTPLIISCRKSILDYEGTPIPPTEDVYNQIMAALNEINEKISTGGGGGGSGANGKDGISCTHEWNGTVLTVTSASGTSSADLKGDTGADGKDGADGYTPVKGTDYWTEADKAEIKKDIKPVEITASDSKLHPSGQEGLYTTTLSKTFQELHSFYRSGAEMYILLDDLFTSVIDNIRLKFRAVDRNGILHFSEWFGSELIKAEVFPDICFISSNSYYSASQMDEQIGDIETALDSIIAIQNTLIGGETV